MNEVTTSSVLRFLTCGSVDDGKSTLIGHLLFQTGNVCIDQEATLRSESKKIGNAGEHIDYSLLLDGLLSEREQGITIDVAYRYFSIQGRKCIVADTPGHQQYTRNMVTGASQCDAAIILIDARAGVLEQTRRHTLICALLGIRDILFVCNKMDMIAWDETRFAEVTQQCNDIVAAIATHIGLHPQHTIIPISALLGDNITTLSEKMPWYNGCSVSEWLLSIEPHTASVAKPFRMSVEYVIKPGIDREKWQPAAYGIHSATENYRAYAGRIHSGSIRVGDLLQLSSGTTASVTGLLSAGIHSEQAHEGESVSITIDKTIDISKGEALSCTTKPPTISNQFKTYIVWMQEEPLFAGRSYIFKSVYGTALAEVSHFSGQLDVHSYQTIPCENLNMNAIGIAELALSRPIPFDPYTESRQTGGFILIDRKTNATSGCGMILHDLRRAHNIEWHTFSITPQDRSLLLGHKPFVLWFTGLSGAGKSSIANCVASMLHQQSKLTYVLDGDNLRYGINKDLGFTPADRVENIRRAGHIAKVMVEAGVIVLTSFISPYRSDRAMVRSLFSGNEFIEIYVATSLEECERRDTKGLYKKARRGELPNMTGIGSPYEIPFDPEITITTKGQTVEQCASAIVDFLKATGHL